ncbi:hypothetical protein MLD38_029196 [Melastoma candidum]|uniref:Uncharacterized protein n=1 Tax=Melastoma candidum TaxID=119954 RepID=A0ACB9N454_9MYRT|nr:hypothetical protein MLD38_029196 [Melastoma candidum]
METIGEESGQTRSGIEGGTTLLDDMASAVDGGSISSNQQERMCGTAEKCRAAGMPIGVTDVGSPYGIMGAFSALMGQQLADRGYGHDIRNRLTGNSGIEALFSGVPGIEVSRGNAGDYFIGPGLEELFERLATTDHRGGTPSAAKSSIDAMPIF